MIYESTIVTWLFADSGGTFHANVSLPEAHTVKKKSKQTIADSSSVCSQIIATNALPISTVSMSSIHI